MSKIPAGSVWPAEGKAHVHPHAALYQMPRPKLFQGSFAPPHEGDEAYQRILAATRAPSAASRRPAGVLRLALSGLSAGGSLSA
eukprot:CAMPEP_0206239758 /NCGR_PEP_ID=MMETSP0047_2-20121206/15564_1 /ASSEMBLY_ACC=CAM_ASM_000192 /TAXON_ID=195065 /ORGANISM="Chroomonas mesostigmatica_cf, Strain CCMP1168" /LENGTH=83 /DNA_ID=CAMNT_0053664471 /DNA_START=222 /DNA_END=470 /DNA_ORIENTATION=-